MGGLRSERWFGGRDLAGFIHRTSLHAGELDRSELAGRPVVGIASCWSELVTCNLHLRGLAAAVRRGVIAAGGVPLEFPTISLGENLMKPTAMLFRNLMSMDVEECIRAYPLDAVVLIGGCDKTVPAQLMGALSSADVPAIALTAGPAEPAFFRGRELGAGTDLWHYVEEVRAGRMTQAEFDEYEAANVHGAGHCNELGTASTIAALVEALGMSLPGTAAIPAGDPARARAAEATGARAVELAHEGLRPRQIVTRRGARQRDHRADGARRRHERGRPPARARRPGGRAARRSTASTSCRAARRCSRTCAPPASTSSRTSTAPAASARCCTSWRRCCTPTRRP